MKKSFIYLDGRFIKANESFVQFLAPGRIEGEGVFETMLVLQKKIAAWPDHYARLKKGCAGFKIPLSTSRKGMYETVQGLLQRNRMSSARLRIMIFRQRGVPRITMASLPLTELSKKQYRQGFKVSVSTLLRPKTKAAYVKPVDYRVFREAYETARKEGFDETILLNSENKIAEGSRTNVFYVKEGVVFTPDLKSGCLSGITRQMVLSCLKNLKIKVRRTACSVSALKGADEAFLTNSLIGVMPLTWLNGKRLGSGQMGKITDKVFHSYQKLKSISLF